MKILLVGEGGQGVQVVAETLARAAFLSGKSSLYIPNFGVEQRGGVSLGFVVLDREEVVYPKFEFADILAIFCDRARPRVQKYIGPQTKVILGPAVEMEEASETHLKSELESKVWNIVILGKILNLEGIVTEEDVKRAMEERFAKWFAKNPALRDLDFKALEEGKKR